MEEIFSYGRYENYLDKHKTDITTYDVNFKVGVLLSSSRNGALSTGINISNIFNGINKIKFKPYYKADGVEREFNTLPEMITAYNAYKDLEHRFNIQRILATYTETIYKERCDDVSIKVSLVFRINYKGIIHSKRVITNITIKDVTYPVECETLIDGFKIYLYFIKLYRATVALPLYKGKSMDVVKKAFLPFKFIPVTRSKFIIK